VAKQYYQHKMSTEGEVDIELGAVPATSNPLNGANSHAAATASDAAAGVSDGNVKPTQEGIFKVQGSRRTG
jgi:hypothetical protein